MISVPSNFVDEMIEHAVQENPNECCGILAGKDGLISALYRVRNSTPSPYRYVMDPKDQMNVMKESDELGLDLMAFYHSHTHSPAYPSETDTRMAVESGWVDFCYVLVSLEKQEPEVRFYMVDAKGDISNEEFEIINSTS
ncbi:MAG: M67 family peptidase [SAR202 cluster bacterium]|nr:MAG: M67 family peptidase [SAR202 cluster bacterium]MEC7884246.1 M67 family metallopeptidase [Chloroflexota bacterium]MQG75539.1 M67 family metallopeptidase [SAR202 cluster bacterium]